MDTKIKLILTIIIGVVLLSLFFWATRTISNLTGHTITSSTTTINPTTRTQNLDSLARCLTQRGAKMYGKEWCINCQNQKNLIGESFGIINYIDCDKDRETCRNNNITGYPTWIIKNKTYIGEQSVEKLKQLTGC